MHDIRWMSVLHRPEPVSYTHLVALTKQAQNDNIVILDDVISQEQYGIAFKKGNDELRDQVWSTLVEMEKDGTVDKIAAKYPCLLYTSRCV